MPSLSAYTPLESLLFFQTLAAHDSHPTNFVSISDVLSKNKFIRENGAFDPRRFTPEALEDLYSRLMHDDGSNSPASTQEPNGHQSESSPSNPKKRKINASRPGFVQYLVPHLYAKYKELVTREIKLEEKRYRDIKDEITRLEKEEREAPREQPAEPAPTLIHTKPGLAPEPMDLDTPETPVAQPQPAKEPIPTPVKPSTSVEVKQPQPEPPRKDQPPTQLTQQQKPLSGTESPAQTLGQQPEIQKTLQPPPPPQPQPPALPHPEPPHPTPHATPRPIAQQLLQAQQPQGLPISSQQDQSAADLPRQTQLPNGKVIPPAQQPPAAAPSASVQEKPVNVPPTQPQKPLSIPVAMAPAPSHEQVTTPLPPPRPSQLPQQMAIVPVASPTPKKAASATKPAAKKSVPPAVPRGPPQASFQQWSLNQPQTPQHPPQLPSSSLSQPAGHIKPLQPLPIKSTPKMVPRPQPVAAPSTPQPPRPAFQTPVPPVPPSGFATPVGHPQGFPATLPRASRPRLSLATPGSSTPWKQSSFSTLPNSPRSPERPRPEDVSPISERAPSPFGSRAATPEESEPPRRKGVGRGRKKVTDTTPAGPKKKTEKTTPAAGRKRDRSTASSRSRGRSIHSRDDESGAEAGKIKREVPSTPAGVGSVGPERSSTSQKVPRGRPKRKRDEASEPEPQPRPQPQPELSQINHADSDQSAPFVLCARNFRGTGTPIMNDVLTHKHASMFAKPLTEREAPGYRDLIYRPQDLKSIKSSISQGSKALAAVTEAANTPVADGESPVPSRSAILMLPKTEDVIPPKAIVNSAQLEKELIRMFTNAVMYNPIPQRGFGPAFPMAPDGGSGRRRYASEPDEGGIVKDTIEMFEDVEQAVTTWRSAEITTSKTVLSLRRESTSDHNMDSADDVQG
ncbi:uncharacterized protein DSM5745_02168 [Aspergillus mulundensis]|uniref:Bromo domain-containing protein n=1 Tax=Aspergillus mulundensis TaxID=1810919 RepID=A0A3D8SVP9_9EURO|nr:Uncharacterized protein DSM5745_02168 [Aspergillus mulundensis]RDW90393.1 Uncharacterized protein DSM5745_02168 [Aspergillus mulundensis]